MNDAPKGLTLLEGLIFGGIIAVLLFATGIAVTAARERVRDYKRLSDVVRVQAALELYFNEQNTYPLTEGRIALGEEGARCLSSGGLGSTCSPSGSVFLNPVPMQTEIGIKKSELKAYAYESDGNTYAISFVIERTVPQEGVEKGVVCAYPGQPIKTARAGTCPLQ